LCFFNYFFKNVIVPKPLFLFFQHTNNAYQVNYAQQHCYVFPKNLIPFEPRSSVPEADAMSTAPRRHRAKAK
jgi:hypothetical protein